MECTSQRFGFDPISIDELRAAMNLALASEVDWVTLSKHLKKSLETLSNPGLSIFSRNEAWSAYCDSNHIESAPYCESLPMSLENESLHDELHDPAEDDFILQPAL